MGGRTRTERRDGFSIDTGAIFLMGTYDATYRLVDQTGAAGRPRRWKARSVLSHGSRRDRLRFDRPTTAVLARSLGWRDRARLVRSIAELIVRPGPHPFDADGLADADGGQTLESWSPEHLGDRSHDLVVRGFMDPLLATDLSRHSLPFLTSLLARPHREALRVPERGLDEVCRALSAGAIVQTGHACRVHRARGRQRDRHGGGRGDRRRCRRDRGRGPKPPPGCCARRSGRTSPPRCSRLAANR